MGFASFLQSVTGSSGSLSEVSDVMRTIRRTGVPPMSRRRTGLVAGTKVATNLGWRPVEAIAVGDRVLTFDSGPQPVVAVTRDYATLAPFDAPLRIPRGVLGNTDEMLVLPDQPVMIESDAADALMGDPFALVPARRLAVLPGVEPHDCMRRAEVVTLHFEQDEVIYVEQGALVLAPVMTSDTVSLEEFLAGGSPAPRYGVLRGAQAEHLVRAMQRSGTATTSSGIA